MKDQTFEIIFLDHRRFAHTAVHKDNHSFISRFSLPFGAQVIDLIGAGSERPTIAY
jgi:hypothetical protein